MNILVIGNGFDLAHGLPTGYTNFLKFCEVVLFLHTHILHPSLERANFYLASQKFEINHSILKRLVHNYVEKNDEELYNLIYNNLWLDYFLQSDMRTQENWIDFENEILKVIQSIDKDMRKSGLYGKIDVLTNPFFNKKYGNDTDNNQKKKSHITFKDLRDELLLSLNKLIRSLEIYITEYIEKLECKHILPDIDNISVSNILSFNYTNTYDRIYAKNIFIGYDYQKEKTNTKTPYITRNVDYDYIHGKAQSSHTLSDNNMVLGINEYLPKDRKNKDVEFISFKKFYQRIYKETGIKYKEWLEEIDDIHNRPTDLSKKPSIHHLYIFGHSLDITDGDILKELILHDHIHTTIFYHNKEEMGRKITNLMKIIGQNKLIKRTGGKTKTITFKLQQPLKEIEQK